MNAVESPPLDEAGKPADGEKILHKMRDGDDAAAIAEQADDGNLPHAAGRDCADGVGLWMGAEMNRCRQKCMTLKSS